MKKIKEYMNIYTNLYPFSGAVLAIKDGEELFKEYFGKSSEEHSVSFNENTKIKIASLTKQFTSMAIMILKESGKLSLNESVTKFFPDYPELDSRITIHHLLSHTSGLFNDFSVVDPHLYMGKRMFSHEEIFDVFKDMSLDFNPGEDWDYCFFGYYLLGVIIERVSKQSFIEFLTDNIFEPLGMNNTGIDDYRKIVSNKASGYSESNGQLVQCEIDTMSAFSSGALYSALEDMKKWDGALYSNVLISKDSMDEMFTDYKNEYGYGWNVETVSNRRRVNHSGGGSGYNHQFHRYLDDKLTVIVLSNYGFTNSWDIANNIADIIFNIDIETPSKLKASKIDSNLLEEYCGLYEGRFQKFDVRVNNKELFFIRDNNWVVNMYPISNTTFRNKWTDSEYSFRKDEDGLLSFCWVKKTG